MRPKAKPKGEKTPCLVCGETRLSDNAHFPKRKRRGEEGIETIPLCPTHHSLLDKGRISKTELEAIRSKRYPKFKDVEEFVEWAHANGYKYSLGELKERFWNYRRRRLVR